MNNKNELTAMEENYVKLEIKDGYAEFKEKTDTGLLFGFTDIYGKKAQYEITNYQVECDHRL